MRRALILSHSLLAAVVAVRVRRDRRPAVEPPAATSTAADVVTTTGHGLVTAVPDRATVTAGVHTQAATAADALSQNARLAKAVVAALEGGRRHGPADAAGLALPADRTTTATVDRLRGGRQSRRRARSRAPARSSTLRSPPARTPSRSDARRLRARDALYRQALAKARRGRARRRRQRSARRAVRRRARRDRDRASERRRSPVPFKAATTAKASDASTPVEAGTQDVTRDVTVTFAIRLDSASGRCRPPAYARGLRPSSASAARAAPSRSSAGSARRSGTGRPASSAAGPRGSRGSRSHEAVRDADRRAAVRHAVVELVDRLRLVEARQPHVVVGPVDRDVLVACARRTPPSAPRSTPRRRPRACTSVEKFVCMPEPFQSCSTPSGFGWKFTSTP